MNCHIVSVEFGPGEIHLYNRTRMERFRLNFSPKLEPIHGTIEIMMLFASVIKILSYKV